MLNRITVQANINPYEVLDELDHNEILEYIEKEGYFLEKSQPTATDYFHGDLNLKALLKDIGLDEVKKIIKEIEEE